MTIKAIMFATIITAMRSVMPTAVITLSIENTMSMTTICATIAARVAPPLAGTSSSLLLASSL